MAERLRCAAEQGQPYTVPTLACFIGADCADVWTRLADLIEPARGSGGRSILCAHCENASWCGCEPGDLEGGCDFEPGVGEGEPPCNLYSLYEVVFRRRPRGEFAIEDDEVRELVSRLLDICNAPGHEHIKPSDTSLSCRDTVVCDRDMLQVTYSRSTCGPDNKAYMVKVRHRDKGWERDFYAVDRGALMELAEELDGCGLDGWACGPVDVGGIARRIREACGEVVE